MDFTECLRSCAPHSVYNVITYFSESKVTVDFFAQRFFFAKRTKKL